jgi:uncharacterized protein (TIGR03382 family)
MLVLSITLSAVSLGPLSPAWADVAPPPPVECEEGAEVGDSCSSGTGVCEEALCEGEDEHGDWVEYQCIACIEDDDGGCSAAGSLAAGSTSLAVVLVVPLLIWIRRRR